MDSAPRSSRPRSAGGVPSCPDPRPPGSRNKPCVGDVAEWTAPSPTPAPIRWRPGCVVAGESLAPVKSPAISAPLGGGLGASRIAFARARPPRRRARGSPRAARVSAIESVLARTSPPRLCAGGKRMTIRGRWRGTRMSTGRGAPFVTILSTSASEWMKFWARSERDRPPSPLLARGRGTEEHLVESRRAEVSLVGGPIGIPRASCKAFTRRRSRGVAESYHHRIGPSFRRTKAAERALAVGFILPPAARLRHRARPSRSSGIAPHCGDLPGVAPAWKAARRAAAASSSFDLELESRPSRPAPSRLMASLALLLAPRAARRDALRAGAAAAQDLDAVDQGVEARPFDGSAGEDGGTRGGGEARGAESLMAR